MKILVGTSKKVSPAVFHMKTKVSLKYFLNVCLWKLFAASLLPQIPLNLILLTILRTPRPLTQFKPKIRAIKSRKDADICHTWQVLLRYLQSGTNLLLKDFQICFRRFFRRVK